MAKIITDAQVLELELPDGGTAATVTGAKYINRYGAPAPSNVVIYAVGDKLKVVDSRPVKARPARGLRDYTPPHTLYSVEYIKGMAADRSYIKDIGYLAVEVKE